MLSLSIVVAELGAVPTSSFSPARSSHTRKRFPEILLSVWFHTSSIPGQEARVLYHLTMAEVAGLVVGVVALASTFKDCISLLSYIEATKTMGYDYEILATKLDIEKTLLLQWADRVRLFKPNYDTRLDDPVIGSGISQTFKLVSSALGESDKLRACYGIHEVAQGSDEPDESIPRSVLSHRRMARLEFTICTRSYTTTSSTVKKIRWVIQHREKFEKLIELVSYCVSKLNELTPTTGSDSSIAIKNDLKGVNSLRELKLLLEASKDLEPKLAIAAEISIAAENKIEERCRKTILNQLWFRKMEERKDMIDKPSSRSLHWSLEPPSKEVEWDDLSAWLESGSDVYWISGKAGSGKSTLMKYLLENQKTTELLKPWGDTRTVAIAAFFLYELGTAEQKSLGGLYRALLYYILDAEPALVPILLPGMWKEIRHTERNEVDLPSITEMRMAFNRLAKGVVMKSKYCFVIDGLDECSGCFRDIISFINCLITSDDIKVLVSSRPLAEFEEAFSSKPKLRLQDLNRDDMEDYVTEFLAPFDYMKYLLITHRERVKKLSDTLVEMSSGMFLWLVLACRSLENGFARFESIEDLEHRIYELPPEINDLFRHMLGKIDKRDQGRAAMLLRICYINCLRSPTPPIRALGLAIAMESEFDHTRIIFFKDISAEERISMCRIFDRRLKSQCYGLIEIHNQDCLLSSVSFLHRSLFEFLSFAEIWDLDCLQIKATYFEPSMIISAMSLRLLRENVSHAYNSYHFSWLISDFIFNAQYADIEGHQAILSHVCELENILRAVSSQGNWEPEMNLQLPTKYNLGDPSTITLPLAVEAQLFTTISSLSIRGKQKCPLLYHFLQRPYLEILCRSVPETTYSRRESIVDALLSSGCDPNESISPLVAEYNTSWKCWVQKIAYLVHDENLNLERANYIVGVTNLFIRFGANIADTGEENLLLDELEYIKLPRPGDRNSDEWRIFENKLHALKSLVKEKLGSKVARASRRKKRRRVKN
ncbi:prion-inhibition and propagation-domain-containing protein [Xylaria curta]|nr:prion-inhibition and propagation-domain-containing protein [Xylaria curta]